MSLESHERARRLLAAIRVEDISGGDRQWLDAHLMSCSQCADEANALTAAIDFLCAHTISAPSQVVRATTLAVHQRAQQLRRQRERGAPLWISVAVSSVWAIVTTPYAWSAFAWLGRSLHLADTTWQLGFLMWWFLPATILSAVAGWQHVANNPAMDYADSTRPSRRVDEIHSGS